MNGEGSILLFLPRLEMDLFSNLYIYLLVALATKIQFNRLLIDLC